MAELRKIDNLQAAAYFCFLFVLSALLCFILFYLFLAFSLFIPCALHIMHLHPILFPGPSICPLSWQPPPHQTK